MNDARRFIKAAMHLVRDFVSLLVLEVVMIAFLYLFFKMLNNY